MSSLSLGLLSLSERLFTRTAGSLSKLIDKINEKSCDHCHVTWQTKIYFGWLSRFELSCPPTQQFNWCDVQNTFTTWELTAKMHVAKCHTFLSFFVTLNIVFNISITMLLADFYLVSWGHVLSDNVQWSLCHFSAHVFVHWKMAVIIHPI